MEEWKDIKGYEGLYQVSTLGRVKSLFNNHRTCPKILKPTPSNCGYYKVELYNNGKSQMKYIHRLVAETFIDNPLNKPQVNHIDGNKANNIITNLEWCSASENQLHSIKLGLRERSPMTGRHGKNNPLSKPVNQYTQYGELIQQWDSIADAARGIGCSASSLSACLRERYNTCHGYKWKYA